MTTATTNGQTTPTCQPLKRGLGKLPCPHCGNEEVTVSIDLDELTGDESCRCAECEAVFSLASIRDLIGKWQRALCWLDTCPLLSDE